MHLEHEPDTIGTEQPVTVLLAGQETDGEPGLVIHLLLPFTLGPAPHRHTARREVCYVLEGVLAARLGEEILVLRAGELIVVPAGLEHVYWNPTAAPTRLLLIYAPGGAVETLRALARGEPGTGHGSSDTS